MYNLLYIVWDDKYNIGVAIIDEQHRGIVTTINSLYYFAKEGLGNEAFQPTITILEQYIKLHFKIEEDLMAEAEYPALKEHILLHEELERETMNIARNSMSEKNPESILSFLKDWWLNHINNEDRKYAPYISKLVSNE